MSVRNNRILQYIVAAVSGGLFAVGLAISGMTLPTKVIGFLDVAGEWDPTLAFVMGGALVTYAALYPVIRKRQRPYLDDEFHVPTRRDISPRLVIGSMLFGVGWGLSGYCPGPAITSIGAGATSLPLILAFVTAMFAGMGCYKLLTLWSDKNDE